MPAMSRQRRVVEVRAAFGDFAEPDRREMRPRLGLGGDRLDEAPDLVGGLGVGCGDRRAHAVADGREHVAEDVAVERGLAA